MAANLRCRRPPAREFPAEIVALCWHEDRPASQAAQDIDLTETAARAPADRAGPDAKTRGNGGGGPGGPRGAGPAGRRNPRARRGLQRRTWGRRRRYAEP